VPEYLAELYVSRSEGGAALSRDAENARRAAEELSRQGVRVRYLDSIYVPEEETCFLLYQADSADAVREAAGRADLPLERVCEAFTKSKGAAP
jgi:hypothetical protein